MAAAAARQLLRRRTAHGAPAPRPPVNRPGTGGTPPGPAPTARPAQAGHAPTHVRPAPAHDKPRLHPGPCRHAHNKPRPHPGPSRPRPRQATPPARSAPAPGRPRLHPGPSRPRPLPATPPPSPAPAPTADHACSRARAAPPTTSHASTPARAAPLTTSHAPTEVRPAPAPGRPHPRPWPGCRAQHAMVTCPLGGGSPTSCSRGRDLDPARREHMVGPCASVAGGECSSATGPASAPPPRRPASTPRRRGHRRGSDQLGANRIPTPEISSGLQGPQL
ncbi:proline-rich protein 2-like [Equus przewalskii]|uniref:Proline-rich protein 2-like n=1 Tax=Equus przewalskii TaxID=9798 RepID=A0ABM4K1X3_EQUPR